MPAGLTVLAPGLHTTVQDLGRIGWQRLGVPVSGALDGVALRLGNALVGNPPHMAALEILYSGPSLEVAADLVRVAVAGIGASLLIEGQTRRTLPAWRSVALARGEVFRILPGSQSVCAYLAIEGGIAVPSVLGSASTLARAGIGGFNGRVLRQGDVVPLAVGGAPRRAELRLPNPPAADDQPIRVVLGPQQESFTEEAMTALLTAEFCVSASADRMGMRLDGPRLRHRQGWDIVSDAIATGVIQVPGSGQPVVLLADHQTTGGYPKIATVISADLPLVGRRRPGDGLRFAAVTIDEAEELARDAEQRLATLVAALEPVPLEAGIDLATLYAGNLISGIVSARD